VVQGETGEATTTPKRTAKSQGEKDTAAARNVENLDSKTLGGRRAKGTGGKKRQRTPKGKIDREGSGKKNGEGEQNARA